MSAPVEPNRSEKIIFLEKIRWPIWLWAFLLFLFGSLSIAVWAALGLADALWLSLAQVLLLILFNITSTMTIKVAGDWLYIDKAKIERKYISKVEVLSPPQTKIARGPNLDPAAFMAFRFWVSTCARLTIDDQRDPTPYWMVSTKAGAGLKKALENLGN